MEMKLIGNYATEQTPRPLLPYVDVQKLRANMFTPATTAYVKPKKPSSPHYP